MKRFLLCCIIVVVGLFVGFTTYYFVANKESIKLVNESVVTQKLAIGEQVALSDMIVHDQPYKTTTIDVELSDDSVVSYDQEKNVFTAEKAGHSTLTITPSNGKFGPFVVTFTVGDGLSSEFPIFIKTAEQLSSIGTGAWSTSMHYELVADIYLTNLTWSPLASFSGSINGNNHTIYDLTINETEKPNVGFVSVLERGGVIKNLFFDNANITSYGTYTGTVVGKNSGLIALCKVSNSTILSNSSEGFTGVIAGANQFTLLTNGGVSARIAMCGVENVALTTSSFSGGIAGHNLASIIENCYVSLSSVNGTYNKFGGIVGYNQIHASSTYNQVSIILKCHANVVGVGNLTSVSGVTAHDDQTTSIFNTYSRVIFTEFTNFYVGGQADIAQEKINKVSVESLKSQATYDSYDFKNIWVMGSDFAVIDFQKAYMANSTDESIIIGGNNGNGSGNGSGTGETIPSDSNSLYEMFVEIKASPDSGKTYTISESATIDVSTPLWKSISYPLGTKTNPFTCHLLVEDGVVLTISNFSSSNVSDASFFGFIGTGGAIKNVTFTNATVSNKEADYNAVFASEISNGAAVSGCKVLNSSILGGSYAGLIAGLNKGSINNCTVENSSLTASRSTSAFGGVAGKNEGIISSTVSKSINMGLEQNANGNFGGIAGVNDGYISQTQTTLASLNLTASANIFAGGIAGKNTSQIYNSTVENSQIMVSTTRDLNYAGGITALNENFAQINKASTSRTNITAYYAGGISALNSAVISKSSAGANQTGTISGIYVGGLVSINQNGGNIDNCLVSTNISGASGAKKVCGFAYKLEEGSLITTSYSCAKISGNGDLYLDTDTPYRNWFSTNIWQNTALGYKMGKLENCLITRYNSNITYQGYGFGVDIFVGKDDVLVSEEEAKGKDNFAKFFDNGFSDTTWQFSFTALPTLK